MIVTETINYLHNYVAGIDHVIKTLFANLDHSDYDKPAVVYLLCYCYCCICCRVINAGKSALNEDQACCEVVELRKRPADPASPSYTPTNRRRSSLPTREALESKEDSLNQESSVSALSSSAPLLLHLVSSSMQ